MDPSLPLRQNLSVLADCLSPASDIEKRGNVLLDKILDTIRRESRFKIFRIVKAGSLGKKTALALKVDYDCVFLLQPSAETADGIRSAVSDWSPGSVSTAASSPCLSGSPKRNPERDFRGAFLDDLADILALHVLEKNEEMGRTQNSIGFEKEGFGFDFLPALYLSQDPETQVRNLATQCLEASREPKVYKEIRTGLVEGTVIFMREQSGFTHRLARLLKYWSHTVLVPGFFNGRSYTLELFACLAAKEATTTGSCEECLLRGFRIALVKIRDFRKLREIWSRFYDAGSAKKQLGGTDQPVLLDVSDPLNNLIGPDRHKFFDKLSEYASETMKRLDALERGVPALLLDLFEPQPNYWNILRNVPREGSFLVGGAKLVSGDRTAAVLFPQGLAQPRIEVRKKAQFVKKEMEMYAHALCALLHRALFIEAGKNLSGAEAGSVQRELGQKFAQKAIESIFYGGKELSWSPSSDKFENKDVELVLPLRLAQHATADYFVQVGFDLKEGTSVDQNALGLSAGDVNTAYWDEV